MMNFSKISEEQKERFLKDAPLGVIFKSDDSQMFNPLEYMPEVWAETPELYYTWLLSRPEYFSFTCKELMNVNIHPFQGVILDNLWKHKFPMLVAARGASKSYCLAVYCLLRILLLRNRKVIICGSGFRQSKIIFEYMENIVKNSKILSSIITENDIQHGNDGWRMKCGDSFALAIPIGSSGGSIRGLRANDIIADEFGCLLPDTLIQTDIGLIEIGDYTKTNAYDILNMNDELETPAKLIKTPKTDVYKVTTQNGYSFSCSNIHQVMTTKGWKIAKDLTKEDILFLDRNEYFPTNNVNIDGVELDSKLGFLMGILVSEGTVTNRNYIGISNTDKELIDKILLDYNEYKWGITEKPAHADSRGFNCKTSYEIRYCNTSFRSTLSKMGIDYVTSHGKTIPKSILTSTRDVIISFLSGLFEGDGSAFSYMEKKTNKKRVGVAYYSASEKMINQLQILLLKFNILCSKTTRYRSELSDTITYMLSIRGESAYTIYKLLNVMKWKNKFDDADFLVKKPNITVKNGKYILSTSVSNRNQYLGSFSSEQECVDKFSEYQKTARKTVRVKSVELLVGQEHLYDFYLPKTHSFYGNGFIQHNSQQLEIFETVIAGFASVASSPTEQAALAAKRMMAKVLGFEIEEDTDTVSGNQIIISGTAYYSFNHFSAYHDRYKKIIKTRGDKNKLRELTGDNNDFINHKDYCLIRLPVNLLPAGFMDESQIGRAKATVHSGTFDMEYMACFSSDSNGFFKRTNIEQCVVKEGEDIVQPNGLTIPSKEVFFSCRTRGDKNKQYIMGVDPAMTLDNFSIVIIELNENHRGVVYCWTTNKDDHMNKQKLGISTENNYYAYCARKIRSLIERFNIVQIALDAQGGGRAVMETINDKNLMIPGELLILPKVDFAKPQDTDMQSGLHIIDVVQFTREDWTSKSNHGMKKDFEDKVLLFPFFDAISFAEAEFKNYDSDNEDTLPRCISEIEELKSELCTITVTSTPATNRERWDTPEYKTQAGKKGRLRKDRYSALLMANMTARTMERATQYDIGATEGGGFAALRLQSEDGDQIAKGNPSVVAKLSALYL